MSLFKSSFISYCYKLLSSICFFIQICFVANAQNFPNIQKEGVRVNSSIKIDGSVADWDHNPLAYNHATEVFYCLANDDDNLYLFISARKREVIEKILLGGVTLLIDPTGKKNDKGVTITFPTYYKNERPNIILKNKPKVNKDTLLYQAQLDSFRRVINMELVKKSKLIEVEGIKSIQDSIISTYNDQGVKAATLFDKQLNYNSEMQVPIKYLNLNRSGSFSYHIKLNGATANHARFQLSQNGRMLLITGSNGSYFVPVGSQYTSYVYATDFWGKYTLAKK